MPSNEYYDSSGSPGTGADVDSSVLRAEYDAIEEGFDKMPVLSGNNNYPVFVNAGGSALESKTPAAALAILGGEGAANKDATGGYVGLTLFKINFKNALNTFTSFFTNANTAARTYTFTDKDGTVLVDTDKDISGGVPGLTLFKINFKNAADTFTSFFTNANSAARTYTFQDRDGRIADDTDINTLNTIKANLATPTFTGTPAAPTAAAGTNTTQLATTAFVKAEDANGVNVVSAARSIGYGTGSGGSVTQATNKGTTVVLNKPCGKVIMNSAALAAGASIAFTLTNSLIAANDVVLLTPVYDLGIGINYSVRASSDAGSAKITVKNETAGTLADALTINFAVIKSAIS